MYLLPDGYTGPVVIVYDEAAGVPLEYEEGKRVYRIPPDGLLETQASVNEGLIQQQYFYVDADGNRRPLRDTLIQFVDGTERGTFAFGQQIGSTSYSVPVVTGGDTTGWYSGDSTNLFTYTSFLVGETANRDSLWRQRDSLFEQYRDQRLAEHEARN